MIKTVIHEIVFTDPSMKGVHLGSLPWITHHDVVSTKVKKSYLLENKKNVVLKRSVPESFTMWSTNLTEEDLGKTLHVEIDVEVHD